MRSSVVIGWVTSATLLLASALLVGSAPAEQDTPLPARALETDSVRYVVPLGGDLLGRLPLTHRGRPAEYRLVRGPALSWAAGPSFYFRSLPDQLGRERIIFLRRTGAGADTLIVLLDIGAEAEQW